MWLVQKRNSFNGAQSEDRKLVRREALARSDDQSEKSLHSTRA